MYYKYNIMETLINILLKETETLKIQYINSTTEWADKYYNLCVKRSYWKEEQWCEYFGITPELHNPTLPTIAFLGFPIGFYNKKESKEYLCMKNELKSMMKLGNELYVFKEKQKAEKHYMDSIKKLAFRIQEKGMVETDIKTVSSHIGVNFNTTITDGIKTIKAFTVLAHGEINRPHYRYLVK